MIACALLVEFCVAVLRKFREVWRPVAKLVAPSVGDGRHRCGSVPWELLCPGPRRSAERRQNVPDSAVKVPQRYLEPKRRPRPPWWLCGRNSRRVVLVTKPAASW